MRSLKFIPPWLLVLLGWQSPREASGQVTSWKPAVGTRIEVEGSIGVEVPVVAGEVQVPDQPGDLTEITAPVEAANADRLQLLGASIAIDKSTDFEDQSRNKIKHPKLAAGTWVKVKARLNPEDKLIADTVRLVEARPGFKVEGELLTLSEDSEPIALVGGIPVRFTQATKVSPETRKGLRLGQAEVDEDQPGADRLKSGPLRQKVGKDDKYLPYTIHPLQNLYFGGELFLREALEDDFNLDDSNDRDRRETKSTFKLSSVYFFGDSGSFALATGEALWEKSNRENDDDETKSEYRLVEGYVFLADAPTERIHLQLGRQDFDEPREWLYSQSLDGGRAYLDVGRFQFEISATTGPKYLTHDNKNTDINNFIYEGSVEVTKNWRVSGYVIDRRDQDEDRDFSPFLYGLRSWGKPYTGLRHWVELARATGVDGFNHIDGNAIDVGATYVVPGEPTPYFTIGYALGTGDRDQNDDREGFRQSGLERNHGKFGGVTSFQYYGDILDPELANLSVLTLGIGIRPLKNLSFDLVGHQFRQDEPSDQLFHTGLRVQPNGISRDLGRELDLIVGFRTGSILTAELTLGVFDPGDAFDQQDRAYLARLDLRFKF